MASYVAVTDLKIGNEDGTVVYIEEGDTVTKSKLGDFWDELVESGSVMSTVDAAATEPDAKRIAALESEIEALRAQLEADSNPPEDVPVLPPEEQPGAASGQNT
jgi:capsule polysaccharide export protein KpsE/RkpR